VVAVDEDLGLHDGDERPFLAQGGIAGEGVGVGGDAGPAGSPVPDGDHGPPLGEAGAEADVLGHPLPQAVEPLGDGLTRMAGQRVGSGVDLDPGHHTEGFEVVGERDPVARRLTERLVEEDHPADVDRQPRRSEEHLPVGPPGLGRGGDPDAVEPLGGGGHALVDGEDPLARSDERRRQGPQVHVHHGDLLN
jgi:hypothetical protein